MALQLGLSLEYEVKFRIKVEIVAKVEDED